MPDVRIAIDCRFAGFHAGLGRYTRALTNAMLELHSADEFVLITSEERPIWVQDHSPPPSIVVCSAPHYSLQEQWDIPRILRAARVDVFFSPHFNTPLLCSTPFVATVHDFILHNFPNNASLAKRLAYRVVMQRCIARARTIICPSDFVKNELGLLYGKNNEARVKVIAEGVDPLFAPAAKSRATEVRERYGIHRPFFLYVGNAKQHKNVPLLLRAFAQAQCTEHELLLVTGGKEAASLSLPPRVKVLANVPDADLAVLYTEAIALVSASCYEGFFLPGAEAIACGCPVIAANRTAIPEVVGTAGVLIDPTVEAFAHAFRNPPSRPHSAPVRYWSEVAQATLAVIKKAVL